MQIKLSQKTLDLIAAGETLIETEELLITVENGEINVFDKINREGDGSYKKCEIINEKK